jgi:cytochrome c1
MTRALALIAFGLALTACGQAGAPRYSGFGGDAKSGAVMITREACGACHEIPGIVDADGLSGPPLTHFAGRTLIAGVLPNTPANLILWLKTPQAVVPGNAMPNMGLTDAQAKDVAAYLYTIK